MRAYFRDNDLLLHAFHTLKPQIPQNRPASALAAFVT